MDKKCGIYYGKILVFEFTENEEKIFQLIVEWLSLKFAITSTYIKQPVIGLAIDHFTRTFTSENVDTIYLTAKEFDLLYFLHSFAG